VASDTFYAAVDIGTTKTCVIIARLADGNNLKVTGVGYVSTKGYSRGRVDNPHQLQTALKTAIGDAYRYFGREVSTNVYTTISGDAIKCFNSEAEMTGLRSKGPVGYGEVTKLVSSCHPDSSNGHSVLHVIPIEYEVDGLGGVRNPVGLQAEQVRVSSHVVVCDTKHVQDIVGVMSGCKLPPHSLVAQSLASAEAVLTEGERELGAVLLDMGGGTTDLTIFRNGNPWFSSVIPLGGMQMTNDLAACLDLPPDVAEEVKLDWGHVMPQMLDPNEEATIPGIDGKPDWNISRRSICQPLHDRLEEILQLVLLRMQQAGLRNLPPGGLVVTGGCAEMPGFEEMLHSMVGKPARVAWPTDVAGLPSHLARPAFAAPLGTLIWGAKHEGRKRTYNGTDASWLEKLTFRRGRRESHEKEMALVTRR
jgi:cell division protein FtsA